MIIPTCADGNQSFHYLSTLLDKQSLILCFLRYSSATCTDVARKRTSYVSDIHGEFDISSLLTNEEFLSEGFCFTEGEGCWFNHGFRATPS